MSHFDAGPADGRQVAALLAEAGWSELLDRLLMRLCHDLNGRIASLYAAVELAEAGASDPVRLGPEVERLVALGARLTALVGDVGGGRAGAELGDMLGRVMELLEDGDRRRVVSIEAGDGLPPVLVGEGRCLRVLLLFVDAASRSGAGRLELVGDADGVALRFEEGASACDAGVMERLGDVAAIDGGSVRSEGRRHALRLPSLARARAAGL